MNKEELIKAIDDLMNEYDAFLFNNKYGENTHKKEFDLLTEYFKNDEIALKAINWIKYSYDYYYMDEYKYDENSAFSYLKDYNIKDKDYEDIRMYNLVMRILDEEVIRRRDTNEYK